MVFIAGASIFLHLHAMTVGISNWSECKQLDIQCRVPTLWDWLPEYGSIEELNDLVTEHCQSMENQQAPVLEM